jgi:hypothetical protein
MTASAQCTKANLVHLVLRIHLGDRARPGAGVRGLRVVTLAGAEVEIIQLDHSRFGAKLAGGFQCMIKQMVGA